MKDLEKLMIIICDILKIKIVYFYFYIFLHSRMSFPNKEDRQACWGCRDEYWQCLDEGKSENECKLLRKQYEKFCPSQWVNIFQNQLEKL